MNDGTGKMANDKRDTDQELGDHGPLADLIALHTATSVEDLWRTLIVGPDLRNGQLFEAVGLFKRHHGNGEPDALATALLLAPTGAGIARAGDWSQPWSRRASSATLTSAS